jgi:hypothetical protein
MSQFYVVLPSDSSVNYFPDNTVAHYKTKLAKRVCTDAEYEVAITELMYPMNMHNFVPKDPLVVDVQIYRCENWFKWQLESGYFKDGETLAEFLNTELTTNFKKSFYLENLVEPIFTYDKLQKQIRCSFQGTRERTDASSYFNWEPESAGLQKGFISFLANPLELIEYNIMYIYCDIVTPYLVGDVQTPLLRAIGVKGERDETITVTFEKPYYLPVARRDFDQIEININTELGAPVPFSGGKSLAVLHFRPRNESFLPDTAIG